VGQLTLVLSFTCLCRDHAHKWLALLQHGGLLVLKGGTQHFMFQPGVCHEFRMNAEGFAAAADWGESPAASQASSSREQPQQQQQQQVSVSVSATGAAEADPCKEVIVTVTVGSAAAAAAKAAQKLSSEHEQAAVPTLTAVVPTQSAPGSSQSAQPAPTPHAKDPPAAHGNVFMHILALLRHGSSKQQQASGCACSSGSGVDCSAAAEHETAA
jgi:hypothetical protein